jgi:peptide-methionine (S)-S-oxide reductase
MQQALHYVTKNSYKIANEKALDLSKSVFATGCFWGAEKGFWRLPGVYSTAAGYIGGAEKYSFQGVTYEDVCSQKTGHAEAILVYFDPLKISMADLLVQFWMCHNPTQVNAQGHDTGTQYRTGLYVYDDDQLALAQASKNAYEKVLMKQGYPKIATEIQKDKEFFYAEDYHQQYLAKPGSRQYCSAQPTCIQCPLIDDWDLPQEMKEKYRNKLPLTFWQAHGPTPHCVINAPNEPYEWSNK